MRRFWLRLNRRLPRSYGLLSAFLLTALPAGCREDSSPSAAPASAPGPAGDTASGRRVMLIGWDGATYRMIDPMLEQGRLPHLRRLMQRGCTARLKSTVIPISSEAWTAISTGGGPGRTGVVGFYKNLPGSYDIELIDATDVAGPPLWRIANAHGLRTVVWGIPITFPVERVDGVMVAGMLAPVDGEYAHPPGLLKELRQRDYLPDLGSWVETRAVTPELAFEQLDLKRRMLMACLVGPRRVEWSLFMVNFKCLDVLSHRLYDGRTDGPVAALLERLDAVLGELVEAAGPQTEVILLSDHGFTTYERTLSVNRLLAELGHAVRRADAVHSPAPRRDDPLAARRAAEFAGELAAMDLTRTAAFADVAEANYGTIRLNLRGREPQGIVAPSAREAVIEQIIRDLLGQRDARTGEPLIRNAWRSDVLYPGPHAAANADIFFEADPALMVEPHYRKDVVTRLGRPRPTHDDVGILVAAGPSFRPATARGEASLLDVAPLALHLLGLPIYAELDGDVPEELLREAPAVARTPLAADMRLAEREVEFLSGYSADQRRNARSDLSKLGYLAPSDAPRALAPASSQQR